MQGRVNQRATTQCLSVDEMTVTTAFQTEEKEITITTFEMSAQLDLQRGASDHYLSRTAPEGPRQQRKHRQ